MPGRGTGEAPVWVRRQRGARDSPGQSLYRGFGGKTQPCRKNSSGLASLSKPDRIGAYGLSLLVWSWPQLTLGRGNTGCVGELDRGGCGLRIGWFAHERVAPRDKLFTPSRNWLALGGAVSSWPSSPPGCQKHQEIKPKPD